MTAINSNNNISFSGHQVLSSLIRSTTGEITSAGSLSVTDCPKLRKITAAGNVSLSRCAEIEEITAAGNVSLSRCAEIEEIVVCGDFSLNESKVNGNVIMAGSSATISDSRIAGNLECAARIVRISNSSIGRIIIKPFNQWLRFTWPFAFLNYLFLPKGQAQAVELSGKNCQVNSVSFEDGAVGKVYVTDGACRPVVTGAEIAVE